jgi:DNA modification methylase
MIRFGVTSPVVADMRGAIVAGHARIEAATLIGLKHLPVIRLEQLSDTELRAYALADNRIALSAGWNREELAAELRELEVLLPQIDLDLSITGFSPSEIDALVVDFDEPTGEGPDAIPEPDITAVVAQPGDLFILGRHRLLCGDATDSHCYARLMQESVATMAFLDPPYNVQIDGHVGGLGKVKHREFLRASGEMTPRQFERFLYDALRQCAVHSIDGAIHYVCMDWRHTDELLSAGKKAFTELKNVCVWVKDNAGMGSFYRSRHEFVFVFKHGTAPHINNFQLGQYGRTRTNVWEYRGLSGFGAARIDELSMHPTVKPLALVVDALRDCSRRDSITLDSFAGSGTTIMAAEQIGRRAFCMELDPAYIDVAIKRWQRLTGRDAVLEGSTRTFGDLALERLGAPVAPTLGKRQRRRTR